MCAIAIGELHPNWLVGARPAAGLGGVTTDYLGLGIEGYPPTFLLGGQEARDIVNSVRALRASRALSGTWNGSWPDPRGGNSALWTAAKAASIAPGCS